MSKTPGSFTGRDIALQQPDRPLDCLRPEKHDCQLLLAINDIDHTRTKACSPHTNGVCERFHKTVNEEF